MNDNVRPLDEQLYDLLTNSNLTYKDIGQELGMAATTAASHARRIISQYNLNPSLLRTSKKNRAYARYCQNLTCHELCYFTAAEIKGQNTFFCSDICSQTDKDPLPEAQEIQSLYKKNGFLKTANHYSLSLGSLARLFEHYNIEPLDFPENVLVTPANIAQRQTQRIKQRRSSFSNTRTGYRNHLGHTVRSSWENNFCLYLNHKKIRYEYEPKVFYFPEKTGARSYVPDYKLTVRGQEVWVEVKGRMTSKDRTKMARIKKHYPDVFKKMKYVAEKPGCPADISYKKLGLKPFAYYQDLDKTWGYKLKHWEK